MKFKNKTIKFFQVAAPTKSINGEENHVRSENVKEILTDVQAIRERQDTTDSCLVNMQRENAALWKEIAVLRQKHQKQQQIVEKLIQFLVTLVQNQGQNVHAMKRKTPLMIEGETNAKRMNHAIQGPVIHDVTNDFIDNELEAAANSNPVISLDHENEESIEFLLPEFNTIPATASTNDPISLVTDTDSLVTAETMAAAAAGGETVAPTLDTKVTVPVSSSDGSPTAATMSAVEASAATAAVAGNADIAIASASSIDSGNIASSGGTLMIPTSSKSAQFSKEYLNEQVESVDIELNWLQEQLQQGGVSFDPELADPNLTSLIEGDW